MSIVALTQDGLLAGVINHTLYPGASSCVDSVVKKIYRYYVISSSVVRRYIDITSYPALWYVDI